ncbi:MAG: epimerase [Parachlamydia sp.]|nr:MAG: epimerase [Parachlamydia sp.]
MKILVTGATGFIGKRLIANLLQDGHEVYALVRIKGTQVFPYETPHLIYVWGDLSNPEALQELPNDIEVAYYLMHSMSEIMGDFVELEKKVAQNFVTSLKKTAVKQIIYLGGIIPKQELSRHLESRLTVENILKESGIPTTILRASIIVGAGGASFEIIRDLVEKLPFMIAPKWIHSLCQPIAIKDILFYLTGVILREGCLNRTFDLGGPDILSFKQMLLEFAKVRGLKRYIISIPLLTPRLSSYWLAFITSVRFSLAYYLVESMKADTYCRDQRIHQVLPHCCLSYVESIKLAFLNISQNEVTSTWMDSWEIHGQNPDIQKYVEVPKHGVLSNCQTLAIDGPIEPVLKKVWSIGGNSGWYAFNWAWKLRGLADKLVGGVGLNRGRRHPSDIQAGDSIDFWRVLKADLKEKHLILFAEMKLPGEAWLEFKIDDTDPAKLIQTATFRPKGLIGRLYWYMLVPFHYFIFGRMARSLVEVDTITEEKQ